MQSGANARRRIFLLAFLILVLCSSSLSFRGAAGDEESRMSTVRRARFLAEFTLSGQSEILRCAQDDSEGLGMTTFANVAAKGEQSAGKPADPRLKPAYRFEKGGWIYVHLEGTPGQIGFQHGYLLAHEIADAFEAVKLEDTHSTKKDWDFFRKAAHEML